MPIGILTAQEKRTLERALHIANITLLNAISDHCVLQREQGGQAHFDTRPMLDPRECKPATLDWHKELLSYGENIGMVLRHADKPYLVRINGAASGIKA